MTGKTVLITGATSGIGLESARAIAAQGAHVVVGARDATRGSAVVDELRANGGSAELILVDVASLASVKRAAERFATEHPRLDVLVNNAGIIAMKRRVNADGHELTWATNFLGLVALTRALQGPLEAATGARVVNVSSRAQKGGRIAWDDLELERGYSSWRAYAQSKLALLMVTSIWAERLRPHGVTANTVHPGAVATGLVRAGGPIGWAWAAMAPFLLTEAEGAASPLHAALSSDFAGISGAYVKKERTVRPNRLALDGALVQRVWEATERLSGLA